VQKIEQDFALCTTELEAYVVYPLYTLLWWRVVENLWFQMQRVINGIRVNVTWYVVLTNSHVTNRCSVTRCRVTVNC